MKKLLFLFSLVFMLVSCQCSSTDKSSNSDIAGIVNVENLIEKDYNEMSVKYGDKDFRYYECDIILNNFLDDECDGTIQELVNIYQVITKKDSTSADSYVYKIQRKGGQIYKDSINGFWIENFPINIDELKVPYDSAYNLVMSVNLPKPHSQYVTLRKPLGPLPCNTQWIFGNLRSQIWVDAVTGEIRESNPAFPAGFNYAFSW